LVTTVRLEPTLFFVGKTSKSSTMLPKPNQCLSTYAFSAQHWVD